ncbi:transporter substrate-binding domain-containing protein [Rhodococcoides kyotonense]|uniref:Polar amino acid transport system substrate-binding protein n=1 Tax=Rhodococcoides kyotonense TaxID=398843 RepID=A0A239N786_9NOCA|nr:transporter substrate-binding domain-containing protein [Rhodococcus kyotonensis]SNT50791.1 polar amino acid transport system substrate-binding protein [Rhodococcus kyotonensis]
MNSITRLGSVVAASVVVAATVAGCSSDAASEADTTADIATPAASDAVVALVPEEIKARGTLRVAVPDIGAPLGYQENGEMKGMDPALGEAVAAVMGLTYEPEMVPFASTLPGLQADRYDISYGEYYVTAERLQVVDFVSNWQDFSSFIVPSDGDLKPESLTDVCGKPIGAMDGSVELQMLQDTQASCTAAGEAEIDISAFNSISTGVLAMSSGRVDGVLVGRGAGENAIDKGQPVELVGQIGGGITATAVARTAYSDQMLEALQKAYESIIESGVYESILEANNTAYGAIDDPTIFTADSTPPIYQ